jgi:uncharacterized protein
VLHGIADLIVQAANPDALVLFGSYAKGAQNVESDIDLFVIADGADSRPARDQELKGLVCRYPIRIDLRLVTPRELAAAESTPYAFLSSALASGVVLYATARGARLLTPWFGGDRSLPFGKT